MEPSHPLNWIAGWGMILAAFVTGAIIGLFFHREGWLGGYESFPRRLVRLGHIALAALGMMNVMYSAFAWPTPNSPEALRAGYALIIGGATMPTVCFLSAWKKPFRHLFFIPVASLIVAAGTLMRWALTRHM